MSKRTSSNPSTTTARAEPEATFGHGDELHQPSGGSHPELTTNHGLPVADNQNSLKANPRGPVLLEDFILREKITHFDHERIPERVVHARGSAAHGFFELTESLAQYTRAKVLTEVGVKTPLFTRFSTVAGGAGSVDTPRDVRGFAASRLRGQDVHERGQLGSGWQQHPGLFHPGRDQISRFDPCGQDGTRPRLSASGERARHLLGLHLAYARSHAHGDVADVGPHTSPLASNDRRLWCAQLPSPRRRRPVDVRQVPLATEARTAVDGVGRSGQDRRRRSRLSSPRLVRVDHVGQLPGVGTRRAAVYRAGSRCLSVRSPRFDKTDPRRTRAAEDRRSHGARSLARQLLCRDRAGGVLLIARCAGHRFFERPAARRPFAFVPRHATVTSRLTELPANSGERAAVPVLKSAARRPHADAATERPRCLRAEFARSHVGTCEPEPRFS